MINDLDFDNEHYGIDDLNCGIDLPFPVDVVSRVGLDLNLRIAGEGHHRRRILGAGVLANGWDSLVLVHDDPWPNSAYEDGCSLSVDTLGETIDQTLAYFTLRARRRVYTGLADFAQRYGGISEQDAQILQTLVKRFGEPEQRLPRPMRRIVGIVYRPVSQED